MVRTSQGFTIVRDVDATPERLWRALTNADELAQWLSPPGDITNGSTVYADSRPGGRFGITTVDLETGQFGFSGGEYQSVAPHRCLMFTWGDPGDVDPPMVTIDFEPGVGGTRFTLDMSGAVGATGDHAYYDGWEDAIDRLVAHIDATRQQEDDCVPGQNRDRY